jgi:hypothetical protein
MRSFLTRSRLGPRLPTATAVEVLLRRLRRRPRRRCHVVHFTLLLLRSTAHGATARIGLRRPLIASDSHVGLPTTRATANLRAASSLRPIVPAGEM